MITAPRPWALPPHRRAVTALQPCLPGRKLDTPGRDLPSPLGAGSLVTGDKTHGGRRFRRVLAGVRGRWPCVLQTSVRSLAHERPPEPRQD